MPSLYQPPGVEELVRASGPQTASLTEYGDNGAPTGREISTVFFLDDGRLRSIDAAEWPAEQARLAAKEQDAQAAKTLRAQIVQTAQSAVGVRVDLLTAAQRNALTAVLFWSAGAIANDATVRPLNEWVKT